MAHITTVAGFTVPLTAEFLDVDNEPVEPTGFPTLRIRDADKQIIHEEVLEEEHETGVEVGQYVIDYLVPTSAVPWGELTAELTAEFIATVDGVEQVGARHPITVTWT